MKGAHQAAIKKAKIELLEAAQKFTECQAFVYKEFLRISIKRLDDLVHLSFWPSVMKCPYCGVSTERLKEYPSPPIDWSCDCFEEESE